MKETVSDEAREDQWGVRSIEKVQHTEERLVIFKDYRVCMYLCMYVRKRLKQKVTVAPRSQTNKNVFSARLNRSVDKPAERRKDGRLLQILAPATAKL